MNRILLGPLALGLTALTACGGESGPSAATVVDSAGVSIVSNSGGGSWTEDDAWSVEEVFRVGGIDADENSRFGSVVSVDVGADGRVYAADNQAREVRVFEADGSFVGTVGSPGDGPGELGQMFMGMFERDGEVWTIDPGAQGIQRFDPEGAFLGAIPFNMMEGIPFRLDEIDDAVVAQRRSFGMDGSVPETGDAIATIGTESPDTLLQLPFGETITASGEQPQVTLLAPEPIWDVADDGSTAQAMTNGYRVEIRDAEGTLQRIITREVEPQPVTPSIEEAVKEAIIEQAVAFGAPREMVEPGLAQLQFAETVPVILQVILEPNGVLWVQRTADIREAAQLPGFDIQQLGSPNWDVFDAEGLYLGRITIPGRFQPLRLIDGVLWGIDLDEFDVQSIVGMRVVR